MISEVDAIQQAVDHLDLVGDLGSADDGDEWLDGIADGLAEIGQLLLHQQARGRDWNVVRDALRGGMSAMGAAEGVVDVDIAERGKLLRERGIVLLLLGVEAQIFEQQGLAGLEAGDHLGGDLADALRREGDFSSSLMT